MSTKNKLRMFMLLLLANNLCVVATAQTRERLNPEQAFQEAVAARTGFPIFDEEITSLKRVESLLKKGISFATKSDALARAAAHGDLELLQLLINHGADVNYADDQGQTVLMLAASTGFYVQCGNDPLLTSYRGNAEEVKALLAAGARLDTRDLDGNTALMLAAQNARSDSVKLLLDAGSDVHLKNKHGWTALIYAANSSGNFAEANLTEIVAALIAGGAELNDRNEQGKTALSYAAQSPAIAALLIRAGAIE